ncbi:MAG: ABC transporter permease [Clostridiales bacterium]|nr:ABC transporter permease [Clostridiales bacterium]
MIHISKRVDFTLFKGKAAWMNRFIGWGIRLLAVALSLVVCGVLIYALTKLNPVKVYAVMANGVFGTTRRVWAWLRDLALLLCISVGLAPAFKMRFWNIGAEGQVLVGGIATAACMIYMGGMNIPTPLLLLIMAATSIVAGAIWGIIPALFKARWNTNETLFTLMMNYIAIQLTSYFIPKWEHPKGSNTVGLINAGTQAGWFPSFMSKEALAKLDPNAWYTGLLKNTVGQPYLLNVLIVIAIVLFMFFYLKKSKHGYEIAVVGQSENTARYAAMNVKKVIVRTMTLSGAICGLGGFLAVAGADHTISAATAGGRGFVAIIVAWLAKFNTFVMILISAVLVFLEKGAIAIASEFSLSNDVSHIIKGIILFFILGSEFFINYQIKFTGKSGRRADK